MLSLAKSQGGVYMLDLCDFEEAEYVIFEGCRFGFVNPGQIYEIHSNTVTEERYVFDEQGNQNYGVLVTHAGIYYKYKNTDMIKQFEPSSIVDSVLYTESQKARS